MSNIPRARQMLHDLAKTLDPVSAAIIEGPIMQHLTREPHVRKARVKNAGVSPEIKHQIRQLAAAHPDMHLSEIGEIVGVNQGRVSEVLNGKR